MEWPFFTGEPSPLPFFKGAGGPGGLGSAYALLIAIALILTPALATAEPGGVDRAMAREREVLEGERAALVKAKQGLEAERARVIVPLEREVKGLEREHERLVAERAALERELQGVELEAQGRAVAAPAEDVSAVLKEALDTLGRYGAKPAAEGLGREALVAHVLREGAAAIGRLGQVRRGEGVFFDASGRQVRGTVVRYGVVAAVGRAGDVAGTLGGAGARGELAVVDAETGAAVVRALDDPKALVPVVPFDMTSAQRTVIEREVKEEAPKPPPARTLRQTIEDGGALGWPILALGAAAVLLALWRAAALWRWRGGEVEAVMAQVRERPLEQVRARGVLGEVIAALVVAEGLEGEAFEEAVAGRLVVVEHQLDAGLAALKTIAAVAPLMGLLGTVVGMIATFDVITTRGAGDTQLLSGGISQALVTTQLGLVVAIPALLAHSGLKSAVGHLQSDMEALLLEILLWREIHPDEAPGEGDEGGARG